MSENKFGERLAKLRESNGWLQRDLAFRMGVRANTISNWEKGISRPNLDQICQLCETLAVTSDHLLGLDKTAMERVLDMKEQSIIRCYRHSNKKMQKAIHDMLWQIDRMNYDVFKLDATLGYAEGFIEGADMKDEWEECLHEMMPEDTEDDDQDGDA